MATLLQGCRNDRDGFKQLIAGRTIYDSTVNNSYKDHQGEWKATNNYSFSDLLALAEFARRDFADIHKLKKQRRGRRPEP